MKALDEIKARAEKSASVDFINDIHTIHSLCHDTPGGTTKFIFQVLEDVMPELEAAAHTHTDIPRLVKALEVAWGYMENYDSDGWSDRTKVEIKSILKGDE